MAIRLTVILNLNKKHVYKGFSSRKPSLLLVRQAIFNKCYVPKNEELL
jgi:hypothetical protein